MMPGGVVGDRVRVCTGAGEIEGDGVIVECYHKDAGRRLVGVLVRMEDGRLLYRIVERVLGLGARVEA